MTSTGSNRTSVRWHNSLIVRVMALCVVLLLCLLGSVYVLTGHYYREIIHEMEAEAAEIAQSVEVYLEEHTEEDLDFEQMSDDIEALRDGVSIEFQPFSGDRRGDASVSIGGEGGYIFAATKYFALDEGKFVVLTARFTVNPQTEVVRAFRNRYLAALTLGFLLALGLMIYLIAKALRPLRELSESCAEISGGNLRDVTIRGSSGEVLALEETFNGMVASLRDKETVEANLRQAQRLSAIGNLAAGVAHDIRNPLNAIKLLSSHALDTLEENPETAGRQINTIREEVNRLEQIVSGFLSLAKEEELRCEPAAIDPLLEECIRLVNQDAEARNIRLSCELRAGDATLLLDRKHLTRAILNILINALEGCPEGGRVRLFSRVTDQSCEIEIRDDGPGMSKDIIERVFEPYFTTKATGTGLGLSITRGIIEEHGGTITISSTEGEGCQVLITMPFSVK